MFGFLSGKRRTGRFPRLTVSPVAHVVHLHYLIRTRLWAQILIAMVAGVTLGLLLSPTGAAMVDEETAASIAGWLALPGHVFLALIQMVVIPLVIASVVLGVVATEDIGFLKKASTRIVPYFLTTTLLATLLGIALTEWIAPGDHVETPLAEGVVDTSLDEPVATADVEAMSSAPLPERLANVIPSNVVTAAAENRMLQLVIFALLVAVATVSIKPDTAKPIVDLSTAAQAVSMKVVSWAMALAPAAVFGLLAQISVQVGLEALLGMSVYVGTVLSGLAALLVFYIVIVLILGRTNPWSFLRAVYEAQLLAFSTSSSAAVMPLSMKIAEEKLGVRPQIAQFIVPLGATVNMDGTALYQVVAAIFVAQVYSVELSVPALFLLVTTTVGASIGAPSAPGVGIVILATILQTIGIPAPGVALIVGVDRILDMARTAVNVTGDLTACTVMNRWLSNV